MGVKLDLGTKDQIGTGKHSITGRSQARHFISGYGQNPKNKLVGICRHQRDYWIPDHRNFALDQTIQSATVRGRVISDGGESKVISLDQPEISDGLYAHWRFDEGGEAKLLNHRWQQEGSKEVLPGPHPNQRN